MSSSCIVQKLCIEIIFLFCTNISIIFGGTIQIHVLCYRVFMNMHIDICIMSTYNVRDFMILKFILQFSCSNYDCQYFNICRVIFRLLKTNMPSGSTIGLEKCMESHVCNQFHSNVSYKLFSKPDQQNQCFTSLRHCSQNLFYRYAGIH